MSRLRVAVAAGLVGLAGFVAGAPTSAGAADLVDAGWWWSVQSGQLLTLPPPPGVDAGELVVQGAPDGAAAIAAVRYSLTENETAPVLSLRFTAEGAGGSAATAVVLACPATTPWRSGSAQPWLEKPVPDCTRQAIGQLSEDAATMTFDLSSFAVDPVVDVVLVPGSVEGAPEGLDGSTFTLVFAPPEDADLVTQAPGAPVPATDGAGAPAGAPAASPPVGAVGGGSAGLGTRPAVTPSFAPPARPSAPALPPSEVAAPATSGGAGVPAFEPASVDSGDAKPVAVVLLVAGAIAALVAGRRDALLRLLGGVPAAGEPAVAGLGRHARAREGAPPTLR